MVYTQALVFANGMSVRNEQENVAEDLSFLKHFRSDRETQKLKHCGRLMKAQSSS
ncbi:hypothetical protein M9458_028616, partial [Cirrhinus mrigala]